MLEGAPITLSATAMVQPLPHRTILSLSAFQGQAPALSAALGVALPTTPRRIAQNGTDYLWSGPASWLVMPERPACLAEITAAASPFAAVTDQSDSRFLLRITGPRTRAALAKLVPIDLHDSAFAPDAVALTLAAHIGVTLWREAPESFVLACFRSYAAALHHAVTTATGEFAPVRG
jgi:sarcosine oxidase subunit gamma